MELILSLLAGHLVSGRTTAAPQAVALRFVLRNFRKNPEVSCLLDLTQVRRRERIYARRPQRSGSML